MILAEGFGCVMAPTGNLAEIKAFLSDALIYFTSDAVPQATIGDYQNTVATNAECKSAEELASRCRQLLKWIEACHSVDKTPAPPAKEVLEESTEYNGYLDMSSGKSPIATACNSSANLTNDYVRIDPMPCESCENRGDCILPPSTTPGTSVSFPDESNDLQNSPYAGLPAAHLALKKSPKQGPLTRIEKRIFFDQSKKYFCGIADDWLLCYTDGATSLKPALCLHLAAGTEVEGYGEGKRREVSFQITSVAGKRYIFQAPSEVEAKAWICAVEGTIRGLYRRSPMVRDAVDATARVSLVKNQPPISNNLRKLPTPPPELKRMYVNISETSEADAREYNGSTPNIHRHSEEIYAEPCPLYKSEIELIPTSLPPSANKYEPYDVPKPLNATTSSSVEATVFSSTPPVPKPRTEIQKITPKKTPDKHEIADSILESNSSREKSETSVDTSLKDTTSPSPTSSTPVRNWFRERLNRISSNSSTTGTSNQLDKTSGGGRSGGGCIKNRWRPRNLKDNFNRTQHSSGGGSGGVQPAQILVASAKGEKVNMIVNKLVNANGRLPIFRGGGSGGGRGGDNVPDEKSSQFICDDSAYELINVSFSKA